MIEDHMSALRRAEIREALDRAFASRGILDLNRRDWLLNHVEQSPTALAYMNGHERKFDIEEIADQIAASDAGAFAIRHEEDEKRVSDQARQIETINKLPPAQRMDAARRLGLM